MWILCCLQKHKLLEAFSVAPSPALACIDKIASVKQKTIQARADNGATQKVPNQFCVWHRGSRAQALAFLLIHDDNDLGIYNTTAY